MRQVRQAGKTEETSRCTTEHPRITKPGPFSEVLVSAQCVFVCMTSESEPRLQLLVLGSYSEPTYERLESLHRDRGVGKCLLVRLREPATGGLHTCVDETKRARELSPEAVSRRQWPVPRPSIAGQESFCDPRSISACGRSGCGACAKYLGQAHRASPPWRLWHGAAAKKASAGEVASAEEKV